MKSKWMRNGDVLVFFGVTGKALDEVDLEECQTSAQILDHIARISATRWANSECIGDLVRELDKALGLQRTRCGMGRERGPVKYVGPMQNPPVELGETWEAWDAKRRLKEERERQAPKG